MLVLCGHAGGGRSVLFLPERDPAGGALARPANRPGRRGRPFRGRRVLPDVVAADGLGGSLERRGRCALSHGRLQRRGRARDGCPLCRPRVEAEDGSGSRRACRSQRRSDELRLYKDASEVAAIRRACALTVAGHRAGFSAVAPGRGEWEVEAAIDGRFRAGGAFGAAFATIVASGPNACVLHHSSNDRVIGEDDLVLIDAGAEVDFYSGDVTRTVPASGRFTPEQRSL